ncbi:hypothetical protein [Streptacidiphilus sp. PAMC 29251]
MDALQANIATGDVGDDLRAEFSRSRVKTSGDPLRIGLACIFEANLKDRPTPLVAPARKGPDQSGPFTRQAVNSPLSAVV